MSEKASEKINLIDNVLEKDSIETISFADIYEVVKSYNMSTELAYPYVSIGKPKMEKGWIIEITAITTKILEIIPNIVKYLLVNQISFQLPEHRDLYMKILFGHFGTDVQNRLIIIYPNDAEHALEIMHILLDLTRNNKYPLIQGSYHLLQGVHVRYDYTNCIIINVSDGRKKRMAILNNGKILNNPLQPLYKHPREIKWIFEGIKTYKAPSFETVVGNKTVRTKLIRSDSKGMVHKGIHFKKWYFPQQCIIKTGRKYELLSNTGTDASTNIYWQHKMHTLLIKTGVTALPYALIEEDNETSMVMELLKGVSIADMVFNMHNLDGWISLNKKIRLKIFELTLQFLTLVSSVHTQQIIHRDISPFNLLLTRDKKLKIIDFGLSYLLSSADNTPSYSGITIGYSDLYHQIESQPDMQEDIYSVGAMLIYLFCGINPALLDVEHEENLHKQLMSITGNTNIVSIICSCVNSRRDKRPMVHDITNYMLKNMENIINEINSPVQFEIKNIALTVSIGATSICSRIYTNNNYLWNYASADESKERQHDDRLNVMPGIYTGISGTIFTQLIINNANLHLNQKNYESTSILNKNIEFLMRHYCEANFSEPGLMTGNYGAGIIISKCIEKGIVQITEKLINSTVNLATLEVDNLNLWDGVSGKGIFIIRCFQTLQIRDHEKLLKSINDRLQMAQKQNGSWTANKKHISSTSANLASGDAGIVLYLLIYRDKTQTHSYDELIHKCLNNLIQRKVYTFKDQSFMFGLGGIAYTFLKAYETFRTERYKTFAETILNKINIHKLRENFSLATGLSGIGLVQLQAAKILKNNIYRDQAFQIASYLNNLHLHNTEEKISWHSDVSGRQDPGLFKGNSGILLFLYRCTTYDDTWEALF